MNVSFGLFRNEADGLSLEEELSSNNKVTNCFRPAVTSMFH